MAHQQSLYNPAYGAENPGYQAGDPPLHTNEGRNKIGGKTRKQFRFGISDDIELLKEVNVLLPFLSSHGQVMSKWTSVATNCNEKYDGERAQKRFYCLIKTFKSEQRSNLKKSGTNEEYGELEQLLQDVCGRMEDTEFIKNAKKEEKQLKKEDEVEKAEFVRNAALEGMKKNSKTDPSSDAPPLPAKTSKRRNEQDRIIVLLEENNAIKRKKLELEERRIALEEKRLDMEQRRNF